jgi:hypothetical protein
VTRGSHAMKKYKEWQALGRGLPLHLDLGRQVFAQVVQQLWI